MFLQSRNPLPFDYKRKIQLRKNMLKGGKHIALKAYRIRLSQIIDLYGNVLTIYQLKTNKLQRYYIATR